VDEKRITVLIDRMTIGDLELMDRAARNELPASELVEFLDRITEDDVRSLPITKLRDITQELQRAVEEASNPGEAEKN